MEVEIFLSTDSKHTVRVRAGDDLGGSEEAYAEASKLYKKILEDFGKGTKQEVLIPVPEKAGGKTCPLHKVEMKLVPAGISKKTGKPYKAFYACPVEGCTMKAW